MTVTKYYFFGGQRVAMSKQADGDDAELTYLHSDHLGSTVLVTDGNGDPVEGPKQYTAYGSDRGGSLSSTDHNFTGQKLDGSGLLYYNARYYDPEIGQFISPDTIVPDPGNVSDYNRYMYTRGNPLKYTDPSGHFIETAWDVVNIGIGAASLVSNVRQGNWGSAALDSAGLVLDVGATALPFVPGGASAAIKASRAADKAVGIAKAADKGGGIFSGIRKKGSDSSKILETVTEQNYTFRGDSRSHDIIFEEGFQPLGDSSDLLLHAMNNRNPPSMYVSTSKSSDVASNFNSNVYVVRPRKGIDVNQALGRSSPFPHELEVAIPAGVRPSDVRAITLHKQGVSILNPNFKP